MEIEIKSKKNNPLLNRTEVYFTVKHDGEKTPGRDIIRNDLAEKLNSKKENILIHSIKTGFGSAVTTGYAKVYSSLDKTKGLERKYVINRNKGSGGKQKEKPKEEKKESEEKTKEEKPSEKPEEKPEKEAKKESDDKKEEKDTSEKTSETDEKKEKPEDKPKKEGSDKPEDSEEKKDEKK